MNLARWLCLILALLASAPLSASGLYALVVGNGDYKHSGALANAVGDAKAIAAKLRKLGFDVSENYDQSRGEMRAALRLFNQKLAAEPNPVAVVFYAGHGIQRNGENYLIPTDADIGKAFEIEDASINLRHVLDAMSEARPALSVLMLDACRNNPFERRIQGNTRSSLFRGAGLAAIDGIQGTVLSYATEPGSVAVDGYGDHSPYTEAVLSHIATPGLSVQDMLNQVGLSVVKTTRGEQRPWVSSSPIPRFCFAGCGAVPAANVVATIAPVVSDGDKPSGKSGELQDALVKQDLAAIKNIAMVTPDRERMLRQLFDEYPDIRVKVKPPENSAFAQNVLSRAEVEVLEATNNEGNRVLPGPDWKRLSFDLR